MAKSNEWKFMLGGKKLKEVEVPASLEQCLKLAIERAPKPVNPPKDLAEFENRLMEFLTEVQMTTFGLAYYLDFDDRKTLKKDCSYENLIDIAIKYEKKHGNRPVLLNGYTDCKGFLKLALEKGYPFSKHAQVFLGISMVRLDLDKNKMHKIAVQAAAQIKWFLKGSAIPTQKEMRLEILNDGDLTKLLEISSFLHPKKDQQRPRTLEDWVGEIDPRPPGTRKGRPSKKPNSEKHPYSIIVTIPGVFFENPLRTNFIYLRYVVYVLTKILKATGFSTDQIFQCRIFEAYKSYLNFYLRDLVDDWIKEALAVNGSLYDPKFIP